MRLRQLLIGPFALLAALLAVALPATALGATAPASGRVSLSLRRVYRIDQQTVTVPGRWFEVDGVVTPYQPGESVQVRAVEGGRRLSSRTIEVKGSAGSEYGRFSWRGHAPRAGDLTVTVSHTATSALGAFSARAAVHALSERVRFGSRGPFVELLQRRLSMLHFYLPQTGVYDAHTGWAIDAYHRMLHLGHAAFPDPALVSKLLDGEGRFHVRFPGQGPHAEADLSDQLLALVVHRRVHWILPISSGKPSTPTILGSYRIYRRVQGYLPDGMYYSDFFIRGYAIHGYDPAPNYPASHGCLRLPIIDAISVFHWLRMRDWVDVYYT